MILLNYKPKYFVPGKTITPTTTAADLGYMDIPGMNLHFKYFTQPGLLKELWIICTFCICHLGKQA